MDNRTFNQIRNDLLSAINAIYDPKTKLNFNVDPNSATDLVAVLVNNIALQVLDKNEDLIRLRSCLNPYKATGNELRDVISYRGLTVKNATPTTTVVVFKGRPNTLIPEGTQLKNDSGSITFLTTTALQLPDSTVELFVEASVSAACSQAGSIIVLVNELKQIDPPISDVTIVGNTQITIGTDEESDQDVKSRLLQSVGSFGMGFLDVMDSSIMNIDGVRSAVTYIGSSHNIPDGSICCLVEGGSDEEIAQTIFEKNSFLYGYYGNTNVTVLSTYLNRPYQIKFMRPIQKIVYVDITIQKISNEYPDNIDQFIFKSVQQYLLQLRAGVTAYGVNCANYINSLNMVQVCVLLLHANQGENGQPYLTPDWNNNFTVTEQSVNITKL
ncbi:MAG: baseplate J/gp47 family protein [Holosporaceae bacterium]|jgi:hypothetical protein|nr:baseplate J/gp47 family protein [Holosporaceae bacterium]